MAVGVTELQVFVASPGDVQKERSRLETVIKALNNDLASGGKLRLRLVQWKTHTHPDLGEDAQDVINRQLGNLGPSDIFIGIMWKSLGTPTKRAPSGTVEEFQRAYDLWKTNPHSHVMFYFNKAPVPPEAREIKQLNKVLAFRKSLSKSGLIAEYKGLKDFEDQVRSHLSKLVLNWNLDKILAGEDTAASSGTSVKSSSIWPPPPQPPGLFIGRKEGLQALRTRLGLDETGQPTGKPQPVAAMWGIGGVGKTTLAAALTYDQHVRKAFPDGILWTSLGERPTLLSAFARWGHAFGEDGKTLASANTLAAARHELGRLLQGRRMLLVVDDVWASEPAIEFKRIRGPDCTIVFATREPEIASELADVPPEQVYNLPPLSDEAGLELLRELARAVVDEHPEECLKLVRALGRLPLALQVAGRMLYTEAKKQRGLVEKLLNDLGAGKKLLKAKAPADRIDLERQTIPTVAVLLRQSTNRLDKTTRERFAKLGVLPRPAIVDEDMLRTRWRVKDPNPTIDILVSRGLMEPIGDGKYQIHALLVSLADSLLED